MPVELEVCNLPNQALAYNNRAYVNPNDFLKIKSPSSAISAGKSEEEKELIFVNRHVYAVGPHPEIQSGYIGLNGFQRKYSQLVLNQKVSVSNYTPHANIALSKLTVTIDFLMKSKARNPIQIDCNELSEDFKNSYVHQVFNIGEELAWTFKGNKFSLCIQNFDLAVIGDASTNPFASPSNDMALGQLLRPTEIVWLKVGGAAIQLSGSQQSRGTDLFQKDFDFGKLGIGGLDHEFNAIFRRAFASRIYPAHIINEMGINNVRGMLLFGPPGCGKTLIARKIGEVLNAREPKIVNGPEILDKYVGGAEEKIRALFSDAEKEQNAEGENSKLHTIIFDEIDAICKSRGSIRDGTGVHDSIVNQLLSKIDGVDSLNNILVIGMTNRKDMLDDALLRPGRLEVHVEIGLPDEQGRLQILKIHTSSMKKHNRLGQDAENNLPQLAEMTKNFTGAEIEGMVKSAASFAFNRNIDVKDLTKPLDPSNLRLTWPDFENAFAEIEPKFGANNEELQTLYRNGIVHYGAPFDSLITTLRRLVEQVRVSARTPLMSVLLEGAPMTGKTAVAAQTAVESGFPFVRIISADSMIGYSEASKCSEIHRVFSDSYKSPLSLILIDDIERIIEYVNIGPRFSNTVLQTLLVLLKKPPVEEGRRLMVIGTTAIPHLLEDLQLVAAFNVVLTTPQLSLSDEIKTVLRELVPMSHSTIDDIANSITKPIGIKQLLLVTEMARTDSENVSYDRFVECLHTCGY